MPTIIAALLTLALSGSLIVFLLELPPTAYNIGLAGVAVLIINYLIGITFGMFLRLFNA